MAGKFALFHHRRGWWLGRCRASPPTEALTQVEPPRRRQLLDCAAALAIGFRAGKNANARPGAPTACIPGGALVCLLALTAVNAPLLTKAGLVRDPRPQFEDGLGRETFARVLHGGRVSLVVGVGAMFIATAVGALVGLLAGFYGGRAYRLLMRVTEIKPTVPALPVAAFAGLN